MKIDFHTIVVDEASGYGNATRELKEALNSQGVEISPGSSVMLNFCMPPDYIFSDKTVGYTPWESTEVPANWVAGLKAVDDLWVTSDFVAEVFSRWRSKDIFVLPHGISPIWVPKKHSGANKPFTFLHVGGPAERKGEDIVLEAFIRAFGGKADARLVYKCRRYSSARVKDSSGSIVASPVITDGVSTITKKMTQEELYDLYGDVDCMVYPTRGEGFGLIPFESIASGLPTIAPTVGVAGSFAGLITSPITRHEWVDSTSQVIHPGQWLDYDVDEVAHLMRDMVDNYDKHSATAFENAKLLHSEFSWDKIAQSAKDRLLSI